MMKARELVPTTQVSTGNSERVIVHHSGHDFTVSSVMAAIFRRRSQEVVASGHPELVPLLHTEGIELLLIGVDARVPA